MRTYLISYDLAKPHLIKHVVAKGTPYYSEQKNRHGRLVCYYRRPGWPKVRLDAEPGTAAMDRAYYAAEKRINELMKHGGVDRGVAKIVCRPIGPWAMTPGKPAARILAQFMSDPCGSMSMTQTFSFV